MTQPITDFTILESMVSAIDGYHPKGPFPLFTKDLKEDTVGWSNSSRWGYLCVLEHMFHQGGYIPDSLSYIAEIIGVKGVRKWESKATQIRFKLFESVLRNGFLTNKHILRDVIKAFKRSDIARRGGQAKASNRLLLEQDDPTLSVLPSPSPLRRDVTLERKVTSPKTKGSFVEGNGFDPDALVAIWNNIMDGVLPKVIRITKTRKDHLRNRMGDTFAWEINQWRVYLERIKASPLLRGESGRDSWRGATFDWAINLTNVLKVLEGNYDERVDGRPLTKYENALAGWFRDGEPPDEKPRSEDYQ